MCHYVSDNNNLAIISKAKSFKQLQIDKSRRNNVIKDGDEKRRKNSQCSSKR